MHTVVSGPLRPAALLPEKDEEVCISIFRSVMRARQRSSTSERMVMVSLTATGQQLFKACYPRILMTVEADLEQRLDTTERATLAKLLQKLAP